MAGKIITNLGIYICAFFSGFAVWFTALHFQGVVVGIGEFAIGCAVLSALGYGLMVVGRRLTSRTNPA